jgi:hypothetical protein
MFGEDLVKTMVGDKSVSIKAKSKKDNTRDP